MSIKILQERCQQLKKLESTIEKVNEEILSLDYDGNDQYFEALQELANMNQFLCKQRKACREAIILHAAEAFG